MVGPYKRNVVFHDFKGNKWEIKLEITYRNNYPEFTMIGESGQCYDSIIPVGHSQIKLIDIWKEWHLNNRDTKKLPSEFQEMIDEICNDIEKEEEEYNLNIITENMLNKQFIIDRADELGIEVNKLLAMCIHCDVSIEGLDNVEKKNYGDNDFEIEGLDYLVCDDNEADEEAKKSILYTIWAFNSDFIIAHSKILDYDDGSRSIIKAIQEQCESGNEAMKKLIDDENEFVEDAISADTRGHFLSSYDGNENEVKVNGEYFYLYKN